MTMLPGEREREREDNVVGIMLGRAYDVEKAEKTNQFCLWFVPCPWTKDNGRMSTAEHMCVCEACVSGCASLIHTHTRMSVGVRVCESAYTLAAIS